jgi:hypothetical protein
MSVIKELEIKITGQVPNDCGDKDYEILIAKLRVICAEYGLSLDEL